MSHIIQLLCYEPAGKVVELTPDDLTRHVLGFGATGSGKTTSLINPIIRQILAWRKHEPHSRPGLLVLDPKGDDSQEKVRAYAREAGREADLVVLSAGGSGWYDLLGGLTRLDQTQTYSRRLLSGTRDMGTENAYWTETRDGLVETALVLLLANGTPVRFSEAISFMQGWWFSSDLSLIRPRLDFAKQVMTAGILDHFSQRRLAHHGRVSQLVRMVKPDTASMLHPVLSLGMHSGDERHTMLYLREVGCAGASTPPRAFGPEPRHPGPCPTRWHLPGSKANKSHYCSLLSRMQQKAFGFR